MCLTCGGYATAVLCFQEGYFDPWGHAPQARGATSKNGRPKTLLQGLLGTGLPLWSPSFTSLACCDLWRSTSAKIWWRSLLCYGWHHSNGNGSSPHFPLSHLPFFSIWAWHARLRSNFLGLRLCLLSNFLLEAHWQHNCWSLQSCPGKTA